MCACACGCFGVAFFLAWLGLWITGTYFVVSAVRDMRLPKEFHGSHSSEVIHYPLAGKVCLKFFIQECDLASVVVSGVTVLVIWLLLLYLLVWFICAFIRISRKGRERATSGEETVDATSIVKKKRDDGNIYDQVPA